MACEPGSQFKIGGGTTDFRPSPYSLRKASIGSTDAARAAVASAATDTVPLVAYSPATVSGCASAVKLPISTVTSRARAITAADSPSPVRIWLIDAPRCRLANATCSLPGAGSYLAWPGGQRKNASAGVLPPSARPKAGVPRLRRYGVPCRPLETGGRAWARSFEPPVGSFSHSSGG